LIIFKYFENKGGEKGGINIEYGIGIFIFYKCYHQHFCFHEQELLTEEEQLL
jgi:hypothetical protein